MGKWILRFFGYYVLNLLISVGLLLLYGRFDPFAGYYVIVLPLTVLFATLAMLIIRYKFPEMRLVTLYLLAPFLNAVSIIGLLAALVLSGQGNS